MPTFAPLLTHRGILGAANGRGRKVTGHADVATNALANVLYASFSNFLRQERIGNEGRAAPIISRRPERTNCAMRSGEVNRPTPTTGLEVKLQ